jgi:P-type Mg2+ transporter
MDAAIIRATDSIAGSDLAGIKFVAETAYDFERRRLSVAVEHEAELQLITKGAFDSVLKVCTSARIPGSRQTTAIDEVKAALSGAYEHASAEGYRVLGLATRNMTSSEDLDEVGMTFEGLLLFKDPAKPDAAAAIQNLQGLGIDLFLITGDNPLAAKHVANEVGLAAVTVLTGQEFADADASSRLEAIRQTRVFAEFDPIQKEQLVKLLRSQGHAVGYFGDGINDAAALKAADVGISVDSAVDVARQAASIVLLDRSLDVIAQGVKLGRRTFVNTLKYVRVGVSAAFGNVLSMAIAAIFMPFLPLLPAQILLLNFLTDFPAVMIAGDNVDDESVTKPRGWEIREIRNFMLTFGLLSSVFDMLTFAVLRLVFNADAEQFRSGWFIESALTELVVMLLLRTRRSLFSKGFWRSKPGSGLLWSSVIISMIVIGLPFTPLGPPLGLEPLPVWLLGTLAGLTALYAGANDLLKRKVIV